ncbi:MAG: ABC transporter permease subunit [Gammaproteobacteria bacterium]|nr:ABC transporter permease subunit [Gammaproteobacteria bacterium]
MKSLVIARREWAGLFRSPLAFSVLGMVQFLLAWLFLLQIDQFLEVAPRLAAIEGAPGVTDLVIAPVLSTAAALLLVIVPLLSMRAFADEQRSGSLLLLQSSPVSSADIVLGKFLGLLGVMLLSIGLLAMMLLSLRLGSDIDIGRTLSGLAGLLLLTASFIAVGLFFSSLTQQPLLAALGSFTVLVLLWLLESGLASGEVLGMFVAQLRHLRGLVSGYLSLAATAYFLVFIAGFLIFTTRRLEARRLTG